MKRKILSLALAAIFMLAPAACGPSPKSDLPSEFYSAVREG